ncbi:hypothetical protein [Streptomyces adustus]|uniref:hypothetical protein n=1 Tax=Streptomyces adustus TaxID=1609272 RepID=UPI00192E5DB4|nr:hypothetical protein [Streptomyces adustus]
MTTPTRGTSSRPVFADPSDAPSAIKVHIGALQVRIWKKVTPERQAVLRLLSGFDISPDQVQMLLEGATEVEMTAEDLLQNPYFASTCTYGIAEHVPFKTVDRALFPPPPTHVTWKPPVPDDVKLEGHLDRRRIEALLTDVLERQGRQGDTVVPEGETVALANDVPLAQPPTLTETIVTGLDLDHDGINEVAFVRLTHAWVHLGVFQGVAEVLAD